MDTRQPITRKRSPKSHGKAVLRFLSYMKQGMKILCRDIGLQKKARMLRYNLALEFGQVKARAKHHLLQTTQASSINFKTLPMLKASLLLLNQK